MGDFPFDIMDVVSLLSLRIRRRQSNSIYTDCPICGDKRGKMNVNLEKNVFRCNYCGEYGGMVALYAKAHSIGNSDAYREICDALQTGNRPPGYEVKVKEILPSVPNSELAGIDEIHQTLSLLLSMLTLSDPHRNSLRNRGLTDEQIDRLGYKSTPDYHNCQSLTERLTKQGCTVKGVPGFYLGKDGKWTVKFYTRTAGMLIPVRGIDGLIRGAQIRLDVPIRDDNEDVEKEGTKYLWLSSVDKHMGVTSGGPVHFVGDPFARTVYITEGSLKADVAHCLMNRSFVAIAGANNTSQLDPVFSVLAYNGTKLIVEAHDMDKYRNKMIDKGASKIYAMAHKYKMESRRLTWNPNHKGIDDWQLALKMNTREDRLPNNMDRHTSEKQRFRIYQLEFTNGDNTKPFAFSGIKALYKAGYEQPPASEYRLVLDSELLYDAALREKDILWEISSRYNVSLPDDYHGRAVSPSDVIELYDKEKRQYFYCDPEDFIEVKFSPVLAMPMQART